MTSEAVIHPDILADLRRIFLDCFYREFIPKYEGEPLMELRDARHILEQYYRKEGSARARQLARYFGRNPSVPPSHCHVLQGRFETYKLPVSTLKRLFEHEFRENLPHIADFVKPRCRADEATREHPPSPRADSGPWYYY